MDDFNEKILRLHNSYRQNAKIKPLEYSKKLNDIAILHCNKMKQDNKLYHINPNFSENIAFGGKNLFEKPDKLVELWFNHPPHKDNMMNKKFKYIGSSWIKDKDGKYYFSCVFE